MLNSLFVILGAGLWATDTLFRHPIVQQISPLTLVFLEHVFAVLITGVWIMMFHRKDWKMGGFKEWIGALFIGVFGSGIATLLFTASFQYQNPSVSILLQKTQPIIVILLSSLFLGEGLNRRFWKWAALALIAAFFVSFPSGVSESSLGQVNWVGIAFALGAAWFWAISTVTGKVVLHKTPSAVLSFWRFVFGLLTLSVMVAINDRAKLELPFVYQEPQLLKSIFWMAMIPGFIAVTIYYRGLSKVPASVATLLELTYPVAALLINAHFLNLHLETVQYVAAAALTIGMIGAKRSS